MKSPAIGFSALAKTVATLGKKRRIASPIYKKQAKHLTCFFKEAK
jgi:hypothetical protein